MQALFQLDAQGDSFLEQIDAFFAQTDREPDVIEYADTLARRAWSQRNAIDAAIGQVSKHWSVDRMAPVDRSILRMAVAEMMQGDDPPPAVIIDEAIELSKEFGEAESPQFVNGVLDAVRKRLASDAPASDDGP